MSKRNSRGPLRRLLALFAANLALGVVAMPGLAAPVTVEIVTRINAPDPQAGMKSTQTLTIDFDNKKVTQAFKTGVTTLVGVDLASVRDKFLVENVEFTSAPSVRVGMTVRGQTASGVLFMPNIDYKFQLAVTPVGNGAISGCHDGYPAYIVKVGSKTVYERQHLAIHVTNLLGTCDIVLPSSLAF